MAAHGHDQGGMDITEQKRTWEVFTALTTWTTVVVIAVLVLMALFLL